MSLTIFGPVLPVLSSWRENVRSSVCRPGMVMRNININYIMSVSCDERSLTSIKVFSESHGALVERISELHPHAELDQVGHFGQKLNDGVLQRRAKELPSELISNLQLLQSLGAGRGLDDVDHHVGCDGVGLQVQSSDGFV